MGSKEGQSQSRQDRVWFDEGATVFLDPMAVSGPDPDHSFEENRYITFGFSRLGRLVDRGYTPLSLSRQPTHGSETIVEMLERVLPEAELIIARFTADDEGRLRGGAEQLKPRVRENVLIEAGFAVIQRRRESIIVALGDTEIPSDFHGIRRIEADKWNFSVEKQLAQVLVNLEAGEP